MTVPQPAAVAPIPTAAPPRQRVAPAPEITGAVQDRHQRPVSDAEVELSLGVRSAWSEPVAKLTTDAEGGFRCSAAALPSVSSLQERDVRVTIVAAAPGFHLRRVLLSLEQTKRPIVLTLQRYDPEAAALWGEVRDRFGEPVEDALVCCADPRQEDYAATDGRGGYVVILDEKLVEGPSRTWFAFHPDHGVSLPVQLVLPVRGQRRVDFDLTQADAQVDCLVRGLDGRPLPRVCFLIELEEEGLPPPGPRYRTRATMELRTGEDGRLLLRGFPPGRYRLRWTHAGEGGFFLDDVPIPERTVATEQMPFELSLPAVPVDFELVDRDGRPLRDVRVTGTATPPTGTEAEPVEYELGHPHRLWLPPGSRGTWRTTAGARTQAGEFAAHAGRVVVPVVLER